MSEVMFDTIRLEYLKSLVLQDIKKMGAAEERNIDMIIDTLYHLSKALRESMEQKDE